MSTLKALVVALLTTIRDRFLTGSLTGSFQDQSNDWFPAPSPTGAGTGRTGSPRGSKPPGTTHLDPSPHHRKDHPMTTDQDTTDDSITYVDADVRTAEYPVGELDLIGNAGHVHVRSSDRCVKRRSGPLCGWTDGPHEGPALPDEHPDPFIAAIERATGCNGATLLEQLGAQGLTVVTVQVEDPRLCEVPPVDLDAVEARAGDVRAGHVPDFGEVAELLDALVAEVRRLRPELERWKTRAQEQLGKRIDGLDTLKRAGTAEATVARVKALLFRHYTGSPGFDATPDDVREIDALADLYDDDLARDLRAVLEGGA